jgi:hypothetical protein
MKKRVYKKHPIRNLILLFIVVFLFTLTVFIFYRYFVDRKEIIEIKDIPSPRNFNLSGKFVENPDFLFKDYITSDYLVNLIPFDERVKLIKVSNEFIHYEVGPLWGRYGIIYMHPKSVNETSWIELETKKLETNASKLYLVVGLGNANGEFGFTYPPVDCADVGFRIKVVSEGGREETIIDRIVSDKEKWVDLKADISIYKGQKLKIIIESYAGGPCGNWNGEHAVLDYVDVLEE